MFEPFSRGYYLGRLYVEPSDRDTAAIDRYQHERVTRELYESHDGGDRLDRPLVMKVETVHLTVHGEAGIPHDTLAVPWDVLEETRIRNPPTLREVLLATADRAALLLRMSATAT